MSNVPDPIFEAALAELASHEARVYEIKSWINQGCKFAGREPMFPDIQEPGVATGAGATSLRIGPDDFFNKPFATAVREILSMREAAGMTRAASIDEIYSALKQGGFNFGNADPDKQKQGLAVSLGKNTVTFRKLPNGLFGLAEWYGPSGKPMQRRRRGGDNGTLSRDGVGDAIQHDEIEAAGSPESEAPAASETPYSADEDGREVAHDTMSH